MEQFITISLGILAIIAIIGSFLYCRRQRDKTNDWQQRYKDEKQQHEEIKEQYVRAEEKMRTDREAIERLNTEKQNLTGEKERYIAELAELKNKLENEKRQTEEKIMLLKEIREGMGAEFKNLSQEILEEKSKKFGKESEKLLAPLKTDLENFRTRVDEIHKTDTADRSVLKQQIKDLQSNAEEYGRSADNLAGALKGDSKIQGDWGEVTLANLLERSGLREGEEYQTQKTGWDEDGNLLRPDVVINLPARDGDRKHLIIDSKISLRAYHDAVTAEANSPEESDALKQHLHAVKGHIKNLSNKHYPSQKNINAPDFVFMFMPIEAAFFAALRQGPDLFSHAYDKQIILCTPTTLMAVLQTVEHIWRLERQNQNTEEIVQCGGQLYNKFRNFVGNLEDIGTALTKADGAYQKAYEQLKTGRGNLIKQANKLLDLGVKSKKPRLSGN